MVKNLADEVAIRTLMDRYIDGVNRRDEAMWASTWSEDATWDLLGNPVSGKDNIIGLWKQMMSGFEFALMMPSSGLFDIDGDSATGHWYLQEHTRDLEGNAAMLLSRYQDSYRRVDENWLYQSRRYEIMYHGPADLSGNYTPLGS